MNKNDIPLMHCGFSVSLTNDNSPTLTSLNAPFESMHNRSGAAGETHYIYGPVAQWAFENSSKPAFLNVGLGLGYIELLIALLADDRPYFIVSLEIEESLKKEFQDYLIRFSSGETEEQCIYSLVLQSLELLTQKKFTPAKAKTLLESIFFGSDFIEWLEDSKTYNVEQKYSEEEIKFNGVFFDPFSEKTSPQIWQDDIVNKFLSTKCDNNCSFSTYAAKGKLNRALKSLGFSLIKKPGYAGKRESTFATRL
jgi:hypothetical protein